MRLAILGLSLLMAGCGGGGDGDSQQPTAETPGVVQPVASKIWLPSTESSLSEANNTKSAIIVAYQTIDASIKLADSAYEKLNSINNGFEVPKTTSTTPCAKQGTLTVAMSLGSLSADSSFQFGQCEDTDTTMNGSFIGESIAGGPYDYQINASIVSLVSDDKVYAKSRLIKHEQPMFYYANGATDTLSFDMTVAGISTKEGINTGGTVIVKTTTPLQFVDALTTSPVGGAITIMNTQGRTWIAKVVPNGFDIYDTANSTVVPVDFLSWYSLAQ